MIHQMRNLGDLFTESACTYPGKLAIVQGKNELSYDQLSTRTKKVAGILTALSITVGDRVMFIMDNDYRFPEWLFGCMKFGAIPLPCNTTISHETMDYIVSDAEPELLVVTPPFLEIAKRLAETHTIAPKVICLDETYEALLRAHEENHETVKIEAITTTALMMYTSGSTGRPKGCLLAHAGTLWMIKQACGSYDLKESDSALVFGPLYHANALWCMLYPLLYIGGTAYIYENFDAKEAIKSVAAKRPTFMSGTPSMFALMLAQKELLESLDVTSMEFVLVGSAPSTGELISKMNQYFQCEVLEGYGSTEAGIVTISPRRKEPVIGSIGKVFSGIKYRIVDDNDEDVQLGEVGELCLQTPALLSGYHNLPEVYAHKNRGGWFHSQDLVSVNEEGYFFFKGRTDDMINCGGENIYPKEVENLLLQYDGVVDAAVIPVKHRTKGVAPIAWVVTDEKSTCTEQSIKEFTLDKGPAYAHPRKVFFIDELPLTGSKKVNVSKLREMTEEQLPMGL